MSANISQQTDEGIMAIFNINVVRTLRGDFFFVMHLGINKDVLSVSCAASNSEWTGFICRS